MIWGIFILFTIPAPPSPTAFQASRAQQYAVYRAHEILPESLRNLVKRHGKFLFEGLDRGLSVPFSEISEAKILSETRKITSLVNEQANFRSVVQQMGYVSGLVAIFTDPSRNRSGSIHKGFHFYLDKKLKRFLFVFDGYSPSLPAVDNLKPTLEELSRLRFLYGDILEKNYAEVGQNPMYLFDERSGVFGVCSNYFSNLARTSAHLWYHAWKDANGDMTQTPFLKKNLVR